LSTISSRAHNLESPFAITQFHLPFDAHKT
jgi:hypothetical protein